MIDRAGMTMRPIHSYTNDTPDLCFAILPWDSGWGLFCFLHPKNQFLGQDFACGHYGRDPFGSLRFGR